MKFRGTPALVVVALLGTGRIADAQVPRNEEIPGWSVVPSLQTAVIYESNVRFTGGVPEAEAGYLTLVPSVETRFRGPLGTFSAGYSFNSEMHTEELRSLDDPFARQLGAISFDAKPGTRTSLSGLARYMSTRRPEEVLDATGLVAGYRRTTSFLANFSIDYSLAPGSDLRVGFASTNDDFGEATDLRAGARSRLQSLSVGLARKTSARTTVGLEYVGRFLVGDEFGLFTNTHGVFWSHTAGVRWTRALTPHLSATVIAGPRVAQTVPPTIARTDTTPVPWEVRPEVLASLTYRNPTRVASIVYGRSQFLGVGSSGFVDTESIEATAGATVARRFRLSARPGIYRNVLAGVTARSYRIDGTADVQMSSWVSLNAMYSHRHQDRALGLSDFVVTAAARSRTRSRLIIGMTIRRPVGM